MSTHMSSNMPMAASCILSPLWLSHYFWCFHHWVGKIGKLISSKLKTNCFFRNGGKHHPVSPLPGNRAIPQPSTLFFANTGVEKLQQVLELNSYNNQAGDLNESCEKIGRAHDIWRYPEGNFAKCLILEFEVRISGIQSWLSLLIVCVYTSYLSISWLSHPIDKTEIIRLTLEDLL